MNRKDDNENSATENTIKIVSTGSEIGHLTMMTGRKKLNVNLPKLLKLKHGNRWRFQRPKKSRLKISTNERG